MPMLLRGPLRALMRLLRRLPPHATLTVGTCPRRLPPARPPSAPSAATLWARLNPLRRSCCIHRRHDAVLGHPLLQVLREFRPLLERDASRGPEGPLPDLVAVPVQLLHLLGVKRQPLHRQPL